MRRLVGFLRSLRTSTIVVGCVVAAAVTAGAILFTSSPGTYPLSVVFPSAQGLFTGAAVRLLGVRIGTVTDVAYRDGAVHVSMQIDGGQTLPRHVRAALITPLLLGQPDVELSPGYTGGPTLLAGTVIPESATSVPVSTDTLLRQLQRVLGAVHPSSLHGLVDNLATDLSGQGAQLHQLISSASGTLQLLAEKGNDLGRMNGSLAKLTGTLRANETQLLDLVQAYDTVSGVIAAHQRALGASIADLSRASAQLAGLLSPNLVPLEKDVDVITTAGRTLDRNLSNLDGIMSSSRALFAGAERSYSPRYKWLKLNNQLAPGLTADLIEGLVRDRLAGICRRVLAHHSAGLPASEKHTLATCGNPDSGYFNPILSIIPTILQKGGLDNPGGSRSASAGSLLGPGLAKIPGLTPSERKAVTSAPPPSSSSSPTSGPRPAGHHRTAGRKQHKKRDCSSSVDSAVDCVLGPLPPVGSSGSSKGGGGGGLLALGSSLFSGLGWSW